MNSLNLPVFFPVNPTAFIHSVTLTSSLLRNDIADSSVEPATTPPTSP